GENLEVDFEQLEELFSVPVDRQAANDSRRLNGGVSGVDFHRRRSSDRNQEISLLDQRKCLSLSILLRQFRQPVEHTVTWLLSSRSQDENSDNQLTANQLKELLKNLPDSNELDRITGYHGDPERLDMASKFVYLLAQNKQSFVDI
uniref:FH2 domain-containing protein n=1 Tax=Macrostomum lignano TaxID=282301 RepID=A0A1I8GCP6_9PLAT